MEQKQEIVDTFPAKGITRQFYVLNCDKVVGWIIYANSRSGTVQYIEDKKQVIVSSATQSLIIATNKIQRPLRGYDLIIAKPGDSILNLFKWDLALEHVPAAALLSYEKPVELKTQLTISIDKDVNGQVTIGFFNGVGIYSLQTEYAVVNIPLKGTFGIGIASKAAHTLPENTTILNPGSSMNIDLKTELPLSLLMSAVTVRREA